MAWFIEIELQNVNFLFQNEKFSLSFVRFLSQSVNFYLDASKMKRVEIDVK